MTSNWSMAERSEAAGVLPADADEFGRLVEEYRRDLVVLSYRFLGSVADAEDAAQETALRAWRARDSFRGEAGVRTWLHRIATRVCLDAIERRGRRRNMPPQVALAADPSQPPAPPTTEILWLEPLPDAYVADAELDPAARYSLRESVSLAFTAALQTLPPRQRAVLLLRDVLAWHAAEVAQVLEMTTSAVNSALNRARATLKSQPDQASRENVVQITDPADRRLLDAYMHAWETDDVDGLVTMLRDEVRLAMPPSPAWYVGRLAVAELVRRWVMPMGPFRMRPSGANLQPTAVLFVVAPDGSEQAVGVHVLTVDRGLIGTIDAFMDAAIAADFVTDDARPQPDTPIPAC